MVVKDLQGYEDTPIELYVKTELVDTDGSETLSLIVTVPEDVTLGYGTGRDGFVELSGSDVSFTNNGDGTVTYEFPTDALTDDSLGKLKVLPPEDSNESFNITITAKTEEQWDDDDGDNIALNTKTITVDLQGVADGTALGEGEEIVRAGVEDELLDLRLDEVALGDSDAAQGRGVSEKASYVIDLSELDGDFQIVLTNDAPDNAMVWLGDDRWAIDPDYLGDVALKLKKDFSNDYDGDGIIDADEGQDIRFTLEVRTTENDGDVALSEHDVVIAVKPVVDPITNTAPDHGLEDEALTLPINLGTSDIDGSEQIDAAYLTSEIAGFDVSYTDGADTVALTWNSTATVTLPDGTTVTGAYVDTSGDPVDLKDVGELTLTPDPTVRDDVATNTPDSDPTYTLTVSVTDHEVHATRTVEGTIVVDPVADTPEVEGAQGDATLPTTGQMAHLNLTTLLSGEEADGGPLTDTTESLALTVDNVPNGAVLLVKDASGDYQLAGRNNGDGSWNIPSETVDMLDLYGNDGSLIVWAPWGASDITDESGAALTSFTEQDGDVTNLTVTVTVVADEDDWTGANDTASATTTVDLAWEPVVDGGGSGGGAGSWMVDKDVAGIEEQATDLSLGTPDASAGVSYVTITMNADDYADATAHGTVALTGNGITDLGNGVWKVDAADLDSVSLVMPEDYAGILEGDNRGVVNLTVEAFDATDTSLGDFSRDVSIKPVAEEATLPDEADLADGALTGTEDGSVSLSAIVATNNDADSESVSYVIRVPRGFLLDPPGDQLNDPDDPAVVTNDSTLPDWVLNDGDGEYDTFAVDSLDGLTIQVDPDYEGAAHWSGTTTIQVATVSTELEGGQAQSEFTDYTLTFQPEADGGVVSDAVEAVVEDADGAGVLVELGLSANLPDTSESFDHAVISGDGVAGDGTVSVDGTVIGQLVWNNGGSWESITDPSDLTQDQLENLALQVYENFSGDIPLSATVFTTDSGDETGLTPDTGAGATHNFTVSVIPEVDGPLLTITDGSGTATADRDTDVDRAGDGSSFSGAEDSAIALNLSAALVDTGWLRDHDHPSGHPGRSNIGQAGHGRWRDPPERGRQ